MIAQTLLHTPPTHANSGINQARNDVDAAIDEWANDALNLKPNPTLHDMIESPIREWAPRHLALIAPPGVGKTHAAINAIKKLVGVGKRILYLVPNHKLSQQLEADFSNKGINAKVFKGAAHYCSFPEALKATQLLYNPMESVCGPDKAGNACPFRGQCGYWTNINAATAADVVICSHEFLFYDLPFGFTPSAVVVDEGFFSAALLTKSIRVASFRPQPLTSTTKFLSSANATLYAALTSTNGFLSAPTNLPAKIAYEALKEARAIVHSVQLSPGLTAPLYQGIIAAHGSTCWLGKTLETVWDSIRRALWSRVCWGELIACLGASICFRQYGL